MISDFTAVLPRTRWVSSREQLNNESWSNYWFYFFNFPSCCTFHPRCRFLAGETDGMIKLDGKFKTVPYDWRVGENKWDGTNEETFLIEIATPTTSLTTELTLFNKSKRRTCKFGAQVSHHILLNLLLTPQFTFHVSSDAIGSNLSSILINSLLFFVFFRFSQEQNHQKAQPGHERLLGRVAEHRQRSWYL